MASKWDSTVMAGTTMHVDHYREMEELCKTLGITKSEFIRKAVLYAIEYPGQVIER